MFAVPYGGAKIAHTTTTTEAPNAHHQKHEPELFKHQISDQEHEYQHQIKQDKKLPPKKVNHGKEIVEKHYKKFHRMPATNSKDDEKIYFKTHHRSPRFAGGFGGNYRHFSHRGSGGHGRGYYDSSSSEFEDYHWKPVKLEKVSSVPIYQLNKPVFTNLPEPDDHYHSPYYHQSHSFGHKPSSSYHHNYYGHGPDDDCYGSSEEIPYIQPKPHYKPTKEVDNRPIANPNNEPIANPDNEPSAETGSRPVVNRPNSQTSNNPLLQIKETIHNVKKVVKDAVIESKKPENFLKPLAPKSIEGNAEIDQDKAEASKSNHLEVSRKIEDDTQKVRVASFNPPLIERTKPLELAPETSSNASLSQDNAPVKVSQEMEPNSFEEKNGESVMELEGQDLAQENRELPENSPSEGSGSAQEEIPEEVLREVFPENPELVQVNNEDSIRAQESDDKPSEDQVNINVRNEDSGSNITLSETTDVVIDGVNPRR